MSQTTKLPLERYFLENKIQYMLLLTRIYNSSVGYSEYLQSMKESLLAISHAKVPTSLVWLENHFTRCHPRLTTEPANIFFAEFYL